MECHLTYLAFETDSEEIPLDNLDEVPIEGSVSLFKEHNPYFGEGTDYTSDFARSPTWLQICVLANKMIETTGDYHHKCLVGVKVVSEEDGTIKARFSMES